jgi:threonine synthase
MEQLRGVFGSGRVDDEGTLDVMKNIYRKYDYPVDPHTAVGLGVAQDYLARHPDAAVVSLATAHPAKFPAAVTRAIGHEPELPAPLADLLTREEKFTVLPADVARVRDFVRQGVRRS